MGALTFASIGWTILIDAVIMAIVVCVFNFLRTWGVSRKFYAPKRYLNIPWRYRPPKLSSSFATWWTALYKIDEDSILACAGLDALTYIRYLSLGLKMSLMVGLVCLAAILPVNWAAGDAIECFTDSGIRKCRVPAKGSSAEVKDLSPFDKTSLANIEKGSAWLWFHLGVIYIVSYIVMKMMWAAQRQAVESRVKYLASTRKGAESHTILVQNIPGIPAGTINQRIYDNMNGTLGFLIPGSVKAKVKNAIENGMSATKNKAGKIPGMGALQDKLSGNATPERLDVYLASEDHFDTERLTGDFYSESGADIKNDSARASGVGADATKDTKAGIGALTSASVATALKGDKGLPISRRFLDLNNRDTAPPRLTDFDTWAQADAAIQHGISVESLVRREFQRTYPENDVETVTVVKSQKALGKLVAEYDKTKMQLEDLIDRWAMLTRAGKPVKPALVKVKPAKLGESAVSKWGSAACKVEKSEFLEWKLNDLLGKVQKEAAEADTRDTCSAFVTFRKRLTQVQASGALHYHNETYWTTEPAAGPQEYIWGNVAYRGWERTIRLVLAWGIFVAMTILFVIPVAAVQALLSVDKLESLPGMDVLLKNNFLRSLLMGILPGLALKIFLALVPMFLRMMNMLQGIYSTAENDFEVGRKYYIFQYTQLFIIVVLGGSMIDQSKLIKDDFGQWIKSLGQAVPSKTQFYISYVLVAALISVPVSMLRIGGIVVYLILSKIVGSDRAKRRLWSRQYMSYGNDVPNHSLTILILLVFTVMQPFMAIPCVLYFTTASFVARYQLLYVFRESYQSGGRFQPIVFEHMFAALVTFQVVMVVVLGLKEFKYTPLLILPLVASFIFRTAVYKNFTRPLANLSAHAAADLDRADRKNPGITPDEEAEMLANMDCEDVTLGPFDQLYVSPNFKVSAADHAKTLEEVGRARTRLANIQAGKPVPPEEKPAPELDDEDVPLSEDTKAAAAARPTSSAVAPATGAVADCV